MLNEMRQKQKRSASATSRRRPGARAGLSSITAMVFDVDRLGSLHIVQLRSKKRFSWGSIYTIQRLLRSVTLSRMLSSGSNVSLPVRRSLYRWISSSGPLRVYEVELRRTERAGTRAPKSTRGASLAPGCRSPLL